jgi:hypothetical protein
VTFRPTLTRLLVALLLLQWGTAFAHCLRLAAPAQGFAIEICTPDGLHRVVLPTEEERGDRKAAAAICPACAGPSAFALPAPSITLAPSIAPMAVAFRDHSAATAPPAAPRRLPPQTGPPAA